MCEYGIKGSIFIVSTVSRSQIVEVHISQYASLKRSTLEDQYHMSNDDHVIMRTKPNQCECCPLVETKDTTSRFQS